MSNKSIIPENIFTHIVDRDMGVDELFYQLYKQPTPTIRAHFDYLNGHLKNNTAKAGQLIIISPSDASQCTSAEENLMEQAREVDQVLSQLSRIEREKLARYYNLLEQIGSSAGVLHGISDNYFSQHKKQIETILKEIEQLYSSSIETNGNLKNRQFLNQRRILFKRLDGIMSRMIGRKITGLDYQQGRIKSSLGLSSKSIVNQLKKNPDMKLSDIPEFANNYKKMQKYSSRTKKIGYLGIGLDIGNSATNIHKACSLGTKTDCTKSKYVESGRLAGSIIGGTFGGAATTYAVCTLVFGIPSGGTSALWCGVVAGSIGGYGGAQALSGGGDWLGSFIYRTVGN